MRILSHFLTLYSQVQSFVQGSLFKLAAPNNFPSTLAGWLEYIEALHPKSIVMGLERMREVIQRLNLQPKFPLIIVAGTNGKGSTCAMLEQFYTQAGYQVACYSSPHLLRYNERVRVNCQEAKDQVLCTAFAAVEAARQHTQLTYFEYGTLAAVWHFVHSQVDVAILEIGLGGRLDAVNAFEPSCTIVTNVDLDHTEFLGDDRDSIGFEKAGVFRPHIPAICGDLSPPKTLIAHANHVGADLKLIGQDFKAEPHASHWDYRNCDKRHHADLMNLPIPALFGDFQLNNAACAITATQCLQQQLPLKVECIVQGLSSVNLPGRFQQLASQPAVIVDVAHNPHAAKSLAENLRHQSCAGKTLAVFAMLADKDIAGVVMALGSQIDAWYVADIHSARGAKAPQLAVIIETQFPHVSVHQHQQVLSAYQQACKDASENDRIIILGSFFTVADVMQYMSCNI
jgi:dihydrofolate synthase / folylpolyglutamate synthase